MFEAVVSEGLQRNYLVTNVIPVAPKQKKLTLRAEAKDILVMNSACRPSDLKVDHGQSK